MRLARVKAAVLDVELEPAARRRMNLLQSLRHFLNQPCVLCSCLFEPDLSCRRFTHMVDLIEGTVKDAVFSGLEPERRGDDSFCCRPLAVGFLALARQNSA